MKEMKKNKKERGNQPGAQLKFLTEKRERKKIKREIRKKDKKNRRRE